MKSTNVRIGGKEFLFIKDSYAPKEVAKLMKQAYELALDNNHIVHGKAADDFIKRMKAQEGKKISKKQQKFIDECVKLINPEDKKTIPSWAVKQVLRSSGLIEDVCKHGVGHPNTESLIEMNKKGLKGYEVHGCDGCCGMKE